MCEFVAQRCANGKSTVTEFKTVLKARDVPENLLVMLRVRPRYVDALRSKLTTEERQAVGIRAVAIVSTRKPREKKSAEGSGGRAGKYGGKRKEVDGEGVRKRKARKKRSYRHCSLTESESEEDPVSIDEDSPSERSEDEEAEETDLAELQEEGEDQKEDSPGEDAPEHATFFVVYALTMAKLEGLLCSLREQPHLVSHPEALGSPDSPMPKPKLTLVDTLVRARVPLQVMDDVISALRSAPRRLNQRPKVEGVQRSATCVRHLKDMRRDTDFGTKRWTGGLYDQWEMPSYYVTQWTEEHEALSPWPS